MANPEFSEDFIGDVSADAVVSSLMGWIGAGCSLALIAGIGWWSYDLAMRDAYGIPVIAALEGPARIAPETPGGFEAAHQGLTVTAISSGASPTPTEEITLAPKPVALDEADQPVAAIAPQARQRTLRDAVNSALQDAGVLPAAAEAAPAPTDLDGMTGFGTYPRPTRRPDLSIVSRAAYVVPETAVEVPLDVDPASLAQGTRLVQLGAYDSTETAEAEWVRISTRFGPYFDEKQRVIERTERGGKVFYRLRVLGFEGLPDARRFCAALEAEKADCIPVQVR